jgi:hypothetical protein
VYDAARPKRSRERPAYLRTYLCTRQFNVSATKISSRGLNAM